MNPIDVTCRDEQRRHEVRRAGLNGLDYLEVGIDRGRDREHDRIELTVYFFAKLGEDAARIQRENVRILGGRRAREVQVTGIDPCANRDPRQDDCLRVYVDRPGDSSTYRLCLVEVDEHKSPIIERVVGGEPVYKPLDGFDRRYTCLEFSFQAGCASDLDCKQVDICPLPERAEPEINYLAKDYASFRQLILDRLALIMPDWQERHVPDLGIALVELLAYTGDYLSYYQDAVATEAYLDTARQRISVRRHARLVDYAMHEGCNARAWVHVRVDGPPPSHLLAGDFYLITRPTGAPVGETLFVESDLPAGARYLVFEPLVPDRGQPVRWRQAHNQIALYTWGDRACCLPQGATRATLVDGSAHYTVPPPPVDDPRQAARQIESQKPEEKVLVCERALDLCCGDFLLFEEIAGPKTGSPADADPGHRHVVRLTAVHKIADTLYDPPRPLLEVEWAEEDALPFPLCLSALAPDPECAYVDPISVARGNVLLADHGRTVGETLDPVPPAQTDTICEGEKQPSTVVVAPGSFGPALRWTPLTFGQPLPVDPPDACRPDKYPRPLPLSAARLLQQDPRQALPRIELHGEPAPSGDPAWFSRRDLLASQPYDQHFVVEMDNERRAHLRFGDDELGHRPQGGTVFAATYRVGNGPEGNVGADALSCIVLRNQKLSGVALRPRNPLPATGGTAPEPLAEVKLYAPHAFRTDLQRAIVAEDYAQLVERDFRARVQGAAAQLRWMGSWYEVLVAVDQRDREEADAALLAEIQAYLEPYRRIGHDVRVIPARHVPLDITLTVCVLPTYLRGHVEAVLRDLFSNRKLTRGQAGFFHPDNLTFGQDIYLSKLVALASAVPGVENAVVTGLERHNEPSTRALEEGVLALGPFEVARLDNDPLYPEHGLLQLDVRGGR